MPWMYHEQVTGQAFGQVRQIETELDQAGMLGSQCGQGVG